MLPILELQRHVQYLQNRPIPAIDVWIEARDLGRRVCRPILNDDRNGPVQQHPRPLAGGDDSTYPRSIPALRRQQDFGQFQRVLCLNVATA